jgi:hypothetical protein
MANFIQVTVYQDLDGNAVAGVARQLAVKNCFQFIPDTSVANANTRIEVLYNKDNALKSGRLYVSEAATALTTAANT